MKLVLPLALFCGLLSAAPELRLSPATIGPVFIPVGQNGPTQTVTGTNIGTGQIALSASANVPWITFSGPNPSNAIQIVLATSALAAGPYSGIVTVVSSGAIDSPQTIPVSVQIGSPIPNSLDLYVAPGGSASAMFTVSSSLLVTVKSPQSGPSLSVLTYGGNFFSSIYAFTVTATASAGTPDGDYPGSLTTTGATSAADNKTVTVTVHVTTQPIVSWSGAGLTFRIAQNGPPVTQAVAFSNAGMGSLTLSLAAPLIPGEGGGGVIGPSAWLSENIQGDVVYFTANPDASASMSALTPGAYQTTAAIFSNAIDSPAVVPIELDVLPAGPPVAYYQGVLDNALFAVGDPLAPGGIVALFGEQLADSTTQAGSLPLGTSLGGATVLVNGIAAPIYYASPGQLDFVIPYETSAGAAVVEVQRDSQTGNSVSIAVQQAVPRLLPLGIGSYGIALLSDEVTYAIPATPGIASRPAQAGVDTVVFYALGLGQTTPPAADGQASTATQVAPTHFVIGESIFAGTGATVTPAYAGLTPGSVGLYQINVPIPANAPQGSAVPVYLDMGGGVLSNRVDIAIQ